MKRLSHVLALLSVGWYLMVPPRPTGGMLDFDLDAPLSHWDIEGSYDTAGQCEGARHAWIKKASRTATPEELAPDRIAATSAKVLMADNSLCIATDDPRLKK